MATIPPLLDLTGSSRSKGEARAWFSSFITVVTDLIGFDGTVATALATLKVPFSAYAAKTTTYAVVEADRGKVIDATSGTFSVTLLEAATAGAGFQVTIRNSGSGTVTVDPNSSETVNGAATLALAQGESVQLVCTGSAWVSAAAESAGGGGATSDANGNTYGGTDALLNLTTGDHNTCFGHSSGKAITDEGNGTFFGWEAGKASEAEGNAGFGSMALYQATGTSHNNSAFGTSSGAWLTSGYNNTFLGRQSGSGVNSVSNVVCLGYASAVSGSDQVQLGDSATTTYAYGSVQNRSDRRDKADIAPCHLGLEFIASLTPVDYRWNYREDYFTETISENGCTVRTRTENDGTKKRNRLHHGFIAQDVKAVMDALGTDFGGYQDHAVNGGQDVLSIGYQELIAPMVKAIQEINARLIRLEEHIETGG
ncbi:MAG: tail fiber domain-containing protein [Magnetococcales bacterium]|nr:tail fiber domain-containing protein [Magnetococcales bacterium]